MKVSAAEFQRFIESGRGNGSTRVKPGSAKIDIVAQGGSGTLRLFDLCQGDDLETR